MGGEVALTTCRYLFTFSWSVLSRKLKILSMFWVKVCWISLLLWGGSVWKVTTSSASRKRMNITNSVCVSYTNREKLIKLNSNIFFIISMPKGSFLLTKQRNSQRAKKTNWMDTAVFHTPCLERVSNSISMSGQCCGHSRLIDLYTVAYLTISTSKQSEWPGDFCQSCSLGSFSFTAVFKGECRRGCSAAAVHLQVVSAYCAESSMDEAWAISSCVNWV